MGCATVAVGYRLAPEHRFPAAIDDCFAALRWIADNGAELSLDTDRIAVAGDSAGGNLAAAMTLLSRDRGGPDLAAQVLVYPNTDRFSDTPSMWDNTDPVFFNNRSVEWYWGHYLTSPADADNPLVSPLRATDLNGRPPALVLTAEYDPLRDQGEQYATRLRDGAVDVGLTRYDGMIHGFPSSRWAASSTTLAWPSRRSRSSCAGGWAAILTSGIQTGTRRYRRRKRDRTSYG